MTAEKRYRQCKLRRGSSFTTGWIEERGAKVGCTVQLLALDQFWEVLEVFGPAIPEKLLREHQRLNRGSLPSIERMG